MNVDNNHLMTAERYAALQDDLRGLYTEVPLSLNASANRLLANEDAVTVPRFSQEPVAKWAAQKRRNKRKAVRASRKANR